MCESSLRPDIPNEDICIGGFSPEPFRSDKPINTRNGGVCLYYKENLPIKRRVDVELLNETIAAEIKINREKFLCTILPSSESVNERTLGNLLKIFMTVFVMKIQL